MRALLLILLIAWCFAPGLQAQQSGEPLRTQLTRPPSSQPAQLRVELTAEGEGPFEPMKPIQFAARAEPWTQDLEYRYHFGDGQPTGWLRDSRYPHTYASPGSYQVFVEVRSPHLRAAAPDPARSNVLFIRVLQRGEPSPAPSPPVSDRVPSRVIVPPRTAAPEQPVVRLAVRPLEVQTGEPALFQALVEPLTGGLEYTFDFGDGQESPRQTDALAEHRYSVQGTFAARVRAYRGERMVAESPATTVTVAARPEHRLLLEATTRSPEVGSRVRFMWRAEPPLEGLLYLVDFGDGESVWAPQAATEHAYAQPGEYRALVRARIGGGEVRSNDLVVAVRAADQGPLYLFISAALAAVVVMVGAWRVAARLRRRKAERATEASPTSSVVVTPHSDPGTQVVVSGEQGTEGPEIRLNPVVDKGRQVMEQGLIIRANRGQP